MSVFESPDFDVANMGGVIGAAQGTSYDEARAFAKCEVIGEITSRVFDRAQERSITPHAAAIEVAKEALDKLYGR